MDTYNEKYLKGTPSVREFLLHVRGFLIVHNIWDLCYVVYILN